VDIASYDLNDGGARQKLLEAIPPDRATVKERHQLLLDAFRREMASRREEGDDLEGDLFENLYWCALLLYLVGDPADVALMWEAKHINMEQILHRRTSKQESPELERGDSHTSPAITGVPSSSLP